jgi:DNA-binding GntR family transcriptional regulator
VSPPEAIDRLEGPPGPPGRARVGRGEEAYLWLRDAIISGELQPDDSLSEAALAARLSTSRTPVREALARLSKEGLVRLAPGRGAQVTGISLTDVRDLFQLREALEVLAARLAATNAAAAADELVQMIERFGEYVTTDGNPSLDEYYALTSTLDDALVRLAGNQRLEQALRDVWAHSRRLRQYASHDVVRLEASAREHVTILTALRDGDADRAEAAVRQHMTNSRRAVFDKFLSS